MERVPSLSLCTPDGSERGASDFSALLQGCALPLEAQSLAGAARQLIAACPSLPQPGAGRTLTRWQFLAWLAGQDLSLVKIYEAHADALAIHAELAMPRAVAPGRADPEIWGVWAARSPRSELRYTSERGRQVRLSGVKPWCSGAAFVTHALVTCVDRDDRDWLAALPIDQPGVTVTARGWEAVGMAATQSVEIDVLDARATLIGPSGAYLRRPGFWHGGAGIAACWYGAAAALAVRLRDAARRRDDAHLNAHLGAADAALSAARALLREAAHTLDATPQANAMALALRVRAAVESAVDTTLHACARGLGAGPLCRDRWFARMAADLPVFVRQSHAEHDLAALAKHAAADLDWSL
ncbi:acyl-CoA dehydrogenase family protein [Paraburkholderia sp. CNPSo 3274]|uniref:acyl-CoA dehydrogenase family protein n=1 Tax=Paraburkholderia sp. CNPSo 3274 TaxID=2940932 RepID=UPI0020B86CC8|nr:acyl-CoA dehydrogenase family protein [Paraburkholderia sp. CNPSo 3274]MCP3712525.1 acyl-CoA dehydrogenase family protein [Paraburkholderia sp. CNPSo 3274]